ncbi:hypothetical protein P7C73_g3129, partial [Tremellales sp. Uapishka_1]
MLSALHLSDGSALQPNAQNATPVNGKGKEKEVVTDELYYRNYMDEERDLPGIVKLIEDELSEPPQLAFLVFPSKAAEIPVGVVVCKQDVHKGKTNRGYIAMLSVDSKYRRRGIAKKLVALAIEEMMKNGANEAVLETEYDNLPSLTLYDSLGFLREKRLFRFYSNGKDAFRLILPLLPSRGGRETEEEADEGRWNVGRAPELEGGDGWSGDAGGHVTPKQASRSQEYDYFI